MNFMEYKLRYMGKIRSGREENREIKNKTKY